MRRIAVALLLVAVPVMPQATERAPLKIPDRVGVSQSQRKLALADAIELALRNNLQIEIDRTVIDESRENFFGARGWLEPHFRVSR